MIGISTVTKLFKQVLKNLVEKIVSEKNYYDSIKLTCMVEVLSHLMVAEQESGSEAKN
jgi:hypothetical protein